MKPHLPLLEWFGRSQRPGSGDGSPLASEHRSPIWRGSTGDVARAGSEIGAPHRLLTRGLIAFFALLLLNAQPAFAAAGIRCDVFLGFDDVLTEGCWCPITFEVENEGPTFVATFLLTSSSYRDDQVRSITVELPTDTIKRFSIPIFVSSRGFINWNVRIVDEANKVRFEQGNMRPRRPHLSSTTALLGALPRTAGGLPVLPKRTQSVEFVPVSARIQTATLPDNPLLLESLTGLYLNSEIATVLRPAQANAVLSWLRAGGHLIVGLEQPGDLTAAPWLRAVVPFEPKDLQTIQLEGQFRDWVNAFQGRTRAPGETVIITPGMRGPRTSRTDLTPLPEDSAFDRGSLLAVTGTPQGDVLFRAGDMPLAIERAVGRGKVTVLCFSPEREPFKSWRQSPEFWAALLKLEIPLQNQQINYANYCTDGVWGALVETKQVHRLPVFWLLVILLGYLAVIGPIDQLVLKRLNRQMLTWITFPCYVLAFSLLIYFIGYKLRAGESEWNEINVVDILPAGEKAELRGRTYASLYSPANQRYELASTLRYATLRNEYSGPFQSGSSTESLEILQKDDAFKARALVAVWTSRLFVSDWWQAAETPVQAAVTRSGTSLTLTVTNRLNKPLRNLRAVYTGRLHQFGEVPPRGSASFTLQPSSGTMLSDRANQWTGTFQQASQQRRNAFGSNREILPDRMDAAVGASVIGDLGRMNPVSYQFNDPGRANLPTLADSGNVVLFGWVDDFSPVPSANQFKPLREKHETLLRLAVPVSP